MKKGRKAGGRNLKERYIALIDLDFSWVLDDIDYVVEEWNRGSTLSKIADTLNRREEEVFILLLDLALKGEIESDNREINITGLKGG